MTMLKAERITTNVVHTIELTLADDKLACLQRILLHLSKAAQSNVEGVQNLLASIADGSHEGGNGALLLSKYGVEWGHWDVARFCRALLEEVDREMFKRQDDRLGLTTGLDESKERFIERR